MPVRTRTDDRVRLHRALPIVGSGLLLLLLTLLLVTLDVDVAWTAVTGPDPGSPTATSEDAPPAMTRPGARSLGSAEDRDQDTAAADAPSPVTLPASVPVRLRIAAIDVDTPLIELGLQSDGTLEVPPDATPAGWYSGAPTPGELGPAIVVGHVDWDGQPGVFVALARLSAGDDITVERADGITAIFRVTAVVQVAKPDFPTALVYGDLDHAGMVLLTCGGRFDRRTGSYEDNVIVHAELVTVQR